MIGTKKSFLALIVLAALAAGTALLGARELYPDGAVQTTLGDKSGLVNTKEYRSDAFGFALELPVSWEDSVVRVSEGSITDDTNKVVAEHVYHFSFTLSTTDKNWLDAGGMRGEAFAISAFPKADLAQLQSECTKPGVYWVHCMPLTHRLAENNKYIFTYLRTDKLTDYPADFVGKIFNQADQAKATFKTFDTDVADVSGAINSGKLVTNWELISGQATDTCTTPTFTGEAKVFGWYEYTEDYVGKAWLFHVSDQDIYNLPVTELFNGTESLFVSYTKNPVFRLVKPSAALEEKLKAASIVNPYPVTVTKFSQYCEGVGVLTIKE